MAAEDQALLSKKDHYGAVSNSNNGKKKFLDHHDGKDVEVGVAGKTTPTKKLTSHHHHYHPHHSILGILLIMLGSFSFSCMFLFVKIMQGTANSFTLVFYRSLVQIAISYAAIVQQGE